MQYVDYTIGAEKEHCVYLKSVTEEDAFVLEKLGYTKKESGEYIEVWVKPYGLGEIAGEYVTHHMNFYLEEVKRRKIERRDDFLNKTLEWKKDADAIVLGFIHDFIWEKAASDEEYELIRSLFMDGYCYYFATILKTAFDRGEVCWCAPFGHFVWLDENGVPYDVEGVSTAEAEYYIPESYISEGLDDFKHVPGKSFGATKEYIDESIKRYEKEKGIVNE